ncbi:MAG: DUF6644 family protein [Vicinamibacterales bacterium]
MSFLPFFKWMEQLSISHTIQSGAWYNPILQVTHLSALALFAGAMLVVDLRLLGQGLTNRPLAQVSRDAHPWLISGFVVLILTGIPQLLALSMKEYYSDFFWWKMEGLIVATIFTFTIRRKASLADEAALGPYRGKIVALVSIVLWTGVTIGARLIGLLS